MDSSRTTAARGASRLARCRERSFLRLYLCIRSLLYACVWAVGCARPAGSPAHDGEGRVTSLESYIWCTSSSTIASISLTATHNRDRHARNAPRARPSLTARSDVGAGRGLSTQSNGDVAYSCMRYPFHSPRRPETTPDLRRWPREAAADGTLRTSFM